MRKNLFSLLFLAILMGGCDKEQVDYGVAECIRQSIETNKNNPDWNIERVEEYLYQGSKVYIYVPVERIIIADAQTPVYSDDCSVLRQLGGFAGNTMCNGERFSDKAVFTRNVWKR